MNAAELFGLNDDVDLSPAEKILALVERMHSEAMDKYKTVLTDGTPLPQVQYRKGKLQALQEVLEMLATGKIPE